MFMMRLKMTKERMKRTAEWVTGRNKERNGDRERESKGKKRQKNMKCYNIQGYNIQQNNNTHH